MPISNGSCWLEGYGPCGWGPDKHHLLNKSKFIGVKKTQAFKKALDRLEVPVCNVHNAQTKQADCKWARKILLKRLIEERGREWVNWAFEEVLTKVKVRAVYSDIEIEAILSGPDR